jgi:peptidoglycan/xylan/chitin deacetylase (PgdA/CDA1 family)
MKVVKEINRKIICPILMNLKGDKIIRNFSANSILNIMYHGVVTKNSNYYSPRHISSEQFEKQLKYFAKEFDVISVPEAFECIKDNYKPKRKTITISFDDGFKNNLYVALPLLEKHKMKSTFFISGICTKEMETRALWTEIVTCLMFFEKNQIIELGDKKFKNFIDIGSKISLSDFLKSCEKTIMDGYLDHIITKYDIKKRLRSLPEELWKLLNKDELKELSASDIANIGSHGYLHYNLANLDISDAKEELRKSKESLQQVIGKDIKIVAYPDGSYNSVIKDLAEQLGYDQQMAVNYLYPADVNDSRILNRYGISSTTTFEANILMLNYAFRSKGYN